MKTVLFYCSKIAQFPAKFVRILELQLYAFMSLLWTLVLMVMAINVMGLYKPVKTFIGRKVVDILIDSSRRHLTLESAADECCVRVEGDTGRVICMGPAASFEAYPFVDLAVTAFKGSATALTDRPFTVDNSAVRPAYIGSDVSGIFHHTLYVTQEEEFVDAGGSSRVQQQRQQQQQCTDDDTLSLPAEREMIDWCTEDGLSLAAVPRSVVHQFNLLHRGIGALVFDSGRRVFVHRRASTKRLFPAMLDMFVGGVSAAGEPASATLVRELGEELNLDFLSSCTADLRQTAMESEKQVRKQGKNKDPLLLQELSPEARAAYLATKADILAAVFGTRVSVNDGQDQEVDGGSPITFLGRTTVETSYNHCIVDAYAVVCSKDKAAAITLKDSEYESGDFVTSAALYDMLQQRGGRENFVPDGLQVWDALSDMTR